MVVPIARSAEELVVGVRTVETHLEHIFHHRDRFRVTQSPVRLLDSQPRRPA